MRNIIAIIIIIFINFIFALPALAVDSTPSASIKAKLEELKRQIASKAAALKKEVDKKLSNKAYIGSVKTRSDKTITLASSTGPKLVTVNQDTVYETQSKKTKYSFKALEEEDYIATLGDIDETGILIAKKIILLPTPAAPTKTFIWGQVVSTAEGESSFLLRSKDLKNTTVATSSETTLKRAEQEISFADIKEGDFVIATGIVGGSKILKSDFLYVLPTGGYLKAKKSATPSATPKTSKPSS